MRRRPTAPTTPAAQLQSDMFSPLRLTPLKLGQGYRGMLGVGCGVLVYVGAVLSMDGGNWGV